MTLVVDASVALKWVLMEEGREAARNLIGSDTLIAPDFLILEAANTLSMKVRRGLLDMNQARVSLSVLIEDTDVAFRPSKAHMPAAFELSNLLSRSAYDSLYLALAISENATLVTADHKFASAVEVHPVHARSVRRL